MVSQSPTVNIQEPQRERPGTRETEILEEDRISNMAKNLFLYVTFRFFSFAYQTLITIFGSPTFIYSRHGFYKYVLFSFFHLFLRKSFEKGTEKSFSLSLMRELASAVGS